MKSLLYVVLLQLCALGLLSQDIGIAGQPGQLDGQNSNSRLFVVIFVRYNSFAGGMYL